MKKLLICFMVMIMSVLPFGLMGCNKKDDSTIRLSEVTHSIFYAPLYVAINEGYFEENGLKIKLSNGGGADKVMTAITSKSADIGLMGPEATIYCHVNGQKDYPIIFGQLTQRDGSFLVARNAQPDFEWTDLKGKRVLAGRAGGVPAMSLQYAVEKSGLTLNDLNFDTTVAFDLMASVFESDKSVDYTTLFEPTASQFVLEGKGYVVAAVGEASGEVAFTSFSASKSYIKNNPDKIEKFLKAIVKGYKFICDNSPETVAKSLAPSFVGTSELLIAESVKRYLSINAWCPTPLMSKTAFENLQNIMENAGTLDSRADYDKAVDNTYAQKVLNSLA